MRTFVRLFFRTLRVILGPFMLLWEWLSRPRGVVRAAAAQANADRQCRDLALYEFQTCPFCIKVRQEMRRLSLDITRVDAQHPGPARTELLAQGGQTKVPCLKITDAAGSRWLYDSEKIIGYLRERFAPVPA